MGRSAYTWVSKTATVSATAAILLAVGLSGCTVESTMKDPDTGKYVSADGAIVVIDASRRGPVIAFKGSATNGQDISSDAFAGAPVVVNFWYATCGPCRAEAATLGALYEQYGTSTTFVGVDTEDDMATAKSFERKFQVGYPSILDAASNDVVLAFAGAVPPNGTPFTFVLDSSGRVAARIAGPIPDESVVSTILDQLLAEP